MEVKIGEPSCQEMIPQTIGVKLTKEENIERDKNLSLKNINIYMLSRRKRIRRKTS